MRPSVGILTTFGGSDEAYSLVVVVKTQLQMLVEASYQPVLFVAPSFTGAGIWQDGRVEVRRTVEADSSAEMILDCLRGMTGDIDVMMCHDILFLRQHEEWAKAIRELAKESPIRWLHWQHSRGDHNPIEPMERSDFCYPNRDDLGHVARINSTTMEQVHYIPHPLDFGYLGWPDLAIRVAEDYQFPFVDVSMIYPTRLDRQKQVEMAVRVFAGLKRAGKSVCLLVADAYATGEHFKEYKRECLKLARELGLSEKEFAFLGEVYEECTYGTPRQTVKALFEMSNLFMQVSTSETSSLVVLEAALAGNLVVLNADFKPIHHLYGKALTLPFGSIFENVKYYRHVVTADGEITKVEDAQQYWDDQARGMIIPALETQLMIGLKRQQLRERWPSLVMREYITPLILRGWNPLMLQCTGDPRVTAIITTMDNLPVLERQVTILSQECGSVIVVNNGSKDGTKEWLDDNPVTGMQVIHRENKGAGPGRNAGLELWGKDPTQYTLMVDGGILPPIGGVALLKDYLERHPEADVISPEVASCFTSDETQATLRVTNPIDQTFTQHCLSSTAYALCRGEAWRVKFSEDGPFGEPGWGVDDNDMAYRWEKAGVVHHEFTSASGWMLYRRSGGSHKRLADETGIWPTQYGSVYEKRNVKCMQDWRGIHAGIYGKQSIPSVSYIIEDVPMPEFARTVKRLHEEDPECEIVVVNDYDPEVKRWLDTFALRWPWGDTTIDPEGRILMRGVDYPEELWSGDVVRNRGPLSERVVRIGNERQNAFFSKSDTCAAEIAGYEIDRGWWSRLYEYPWALKFAGEGQVVADMGCGWQQRPFKDALAKICTKVYAVDQHWEIRDQASYDNLEYVVADFTRKIEAISDESLDRVFCISVLEELSPGKIGDALKEFFRCLKPGGLCVITCDVQYDLDAPLGCYGAVVMDDLGEAMLAAGFTWDKWDWNKSGAIHETNFNLCVFHCVGRKP
jgi:glycosyltransferase involved in cell wall biosynthesis